MNYLPIFANVQQRPVLVVGGGKIAQRKIDLLLQAGAQVSVVAQTCNEQIQQWCDEGKVCWIGKIFQEEQVAKVFLVIAATNDAVLNQGVFQAALAYQKWVNVVDQPDLCNFIFPSIIDRSPVQIAVSTGGMAPVLARLLREKLEALLPQNLGAMAKTAFSWRSRVKEAIPDLSHRRCFWEKLFNHTSFQMAHDNFNANTDGIVASLLYQDSSKKSVGSVSLVGAGPGDAGLLTLKGLQRIQQADVVVYDALVSKAILDLIRRDAELICVGKRAKGHRVEQETINQLLLDLAKQGKRVVRLKGGDPFVFGRGGEELEVLAEAGIQFEVVPGITAALGATAYAGVALTHRDYAQTAVLVTGHCRADGQEPDWALLAQSRQTLAVYMGTIKAAELAMKLQEYGRLATTPVAVISQGTLPEQHVAYGQLKDLAQLAKQATAPALMVIGETVALSEKLTWFGTKSTDFVGYQ